LYAGRVCGIPALPFPGSTVDADFHKLKVTSSFPVDSRDFPVVKSLFQSVLTITRSASDRSQEATLSRSVRRNELEMQQENVT
jgi:hypothetical protein